jgi:hypothetical protein
VLIAGHGRVAAAAKLGLMVPIPVIVARGWSEEASTRTGLVHPHFRIEAAILSTSAALCSRGLLAYGINFSIGHSSTRSAGHGRVGLATAARDSIDVIIHLATALAVRYVWSNKNA